MNIKEQFLGFYNTPALFDKLNTLEQFKFEEIDLNKIDYSELIIDKKLPLGKRVEYFFEYYIKLALRYNIVNKNIQIIKDGNTLGELDFILYDKVEKRYEHVELVYKYYVYDPSFENELDRYIGPNRNDTLVKKVNKLKDKQLPLLFNDNTKSYLNDINLKNIKQTVCYKANIYIPLGFNSENTTFFHNCEIRGFYIKRDEFISQKAFTGFIYKLPHRYDWVCDENLNDEWVSYEEALEEIDFFLEHKKSPLVWMKDKETIKSFFVTWW